MFLFIGSGGVEYEFLINGTTAQARSGSNTFISTTLSNSDEVTVIAYDSATVSACSDESDAIEIEISAAPVASFLLPQQMTPSVQVMRGYFHSWFWGTCNGILRV